MTWTGRTLSLPMLQLPQLACYRTMCLVACQPGTPSHENTYIHSPTWGHLLSCYQTINRKNDFDDTLTVSGYLLVPLMVKFSGFIDQAAFSWNMKHENILKSNYIRHLFLKNRSMTLIFNQSTFFIKFVNCYAMYILIFLFSEELFGFHTW